MRILTIEADHIEIRITIYLATPKAPLNLREEGRRTTIWWLKTKVRLTLLTSKDTTQLSIKEVTTSRGSLMARCTRN